MKKETTGIVRKMDGLGRIVLPIEMRKSFQLREGTPVEITVIKGGILLRKYDPAPSINSTITQLIQQIEDEQFSEPEQGALINKAHEMQRLLKLVKENGR